MPASRAVVGRRPVAPGAVISSSALPSVRLSPQAGNRPVRGDCRALGFATWCLARARLNWRRPRRRTERDGAGGIVRRPPPSGPGDEVVDHAPRGDPSALGPRQYPEPPLPPELDDGVETAAAAPDTMTSCHTPPDTLRPLPLAWPGAVSPT